VCLPCHQAPRLGASFSPFLPFFLLVPFIARKMDRWEVGRGGGGGEGLLAKGKIVHGGSSGKRSLSGVTASCHWVCQSGNVSSEEWGSVEVAGGPLGLQEW